MESKYISSTVSTADKETHDRECRDRLATTGFADQTMGLAPIDCQRDATDRGNGTAERDVEVGHFEDRAHDRPAPRTLRNPSPSRLMPNTSTNSATPGIIMT